MGAGDHNRKSSRSVEDINVSIDRAPCLMPYGEDSGKGIARSGTDQSEEIIVQILASTSTDQISAFVAAGHSDKPPNPICSPKAHI